MSAGNHQEISGTYALFAILILVKISAFDDYDASVIRVVMRTGVIARLEFRERCVRTIVRVTVKDRGGYRA